MHKGLNVALMCLLVFVLAGCGERNQRIDNMKFAAWDNCVKQGGVPLGAWWDSRTFLSRQKTNNKLRGGAAVPCEART